ncbi:hypothetical protein SDC9_65850 [bioreactor metagenome]|uniref:Uncharacterized protein n=1 Tax=bioreactor metagenome TaxID=1076179 RepID=A0A644XT86_9ZZZZ
MAHKVPLGHGVGQDIRHSLDDPVAVFKAVNVVIGLEIVNIQIEHAAGGLLPEGLAELVLDERVAGHGGQWIELRSVADLDFNGLVEEVFNRDDAAVFPLLGHGDKVIYGGIRSGHSQPTGGVYRRFIIHAEEVPAHDGGNALSGIQVVSVKPAHQGVEPVSGHHALHDTLPRDAEALGSLAAFEHFVSLRDGDGLVDGGRADAEISDVDIREVIAVNVIFPRVLLHHHAHHLGRNRAGNGSGTLDEVTLSVLNADVDEGLQLARSFNALGN